jgi:hypothetical protein
LVHPEHRRHGIGKALLLHCLEHLDRLGIQSIKLDATPLGKTLYDQLGFHQEWTLSRWEGEKPQDSTPLHAAELGSCTQADFEWIDELDSAAFGVSRLRMLRLLNDQSRCLRICASETERGYGFVRQGARASYVGPVVANSAPAGIELVRALIDAVSEGRIYWDIPDENEEAISLANQLGFRPQRSLIRMYRGRNDHPGKPPCCFAIADPSIG